MTDQPAAQECPYCREAIQVGATKCKHCGSQIELLARPDHEGACPFCKEKIHPEAIKCRHCKSMLAGDDVDAPTELDIAVRDDGLVDEIGTSAFSGTTSPAGYSGPPRNLRLVCSNELVCRPKWQWRHLPTGAWGWIRLSECRREYVCRIV